MYESEIRKILMGVKENHVDINDAIQNLKDLPFQDLGFANIDHHRQIRTGYPEVIYCEGKTVEQVKLIAKAMVEKNVNVLMTRVSKEMYEAVQSLHEQVEYHESARIIFIKCQAIEVSEKKVLVLTGGTSDMPVAEEAALTAEALGSQVVRLYDVGVAGIHRLLSRKDMIEEASVIIAVAGMEGALPSVVGGLVEVPVIAVPTSVGYGAQFNGLAALLAMLNSCASGIGVVNIDNGFGAGYLASSIIKQIEKERKHG
ncbi:MAG: nickel pincer cofactor biosynthesis protein LarB [Clostridia bacterium]|nr:nickel pincer cofactor biosynthesis protein LarB [Clostridia bacterium]